MNLMIQPNQICLIVKLYNNRPELLPDSNDMIYLNGHYSEYEDYHDIIPKDTVFKYMPFFTEAEYNKYLKLDRKYRLGEL